ncbi:ATP-binding cassette domain-containing protein [Brevibacillus fluminis]|uniref:ATP-binding cassette domain-containing protein n=1 Tax=Brevibacillus fluminis TaxID=511487 RepID=A0A3M8DR28_9BACL|nr:oligopeptide/dipeptide ABC transporter ATP-binding protein [Brevibacillus fluminis]RNB89901.1 ATP-binding cassette domain-containing protein [Brevibacillus fluminis]
MQALLKVENLKKYFPAGKTNFFGKHQQLLKAVDDVSFTINKGEIFGLVGESGCGKSTTGRCILRVNDPTSGSVQFAGREVTEFSPKELQELRREMQMVFQNPYSSLNPRMTIRQTLEEVLAVHGIATGQKATERIAELLELVGLPADAMDRHPHEFSGGQLQRIGIARALSVEPSFIFADEPVSALDVSVQAQILNLMAKLRDELGLTMLFVAHDLSVVEHISDRVGVMYLGQIVEMGDVEQLFNDTRHPYTQALMAAIPVADPKRKKTEILLEGDIPSPIDPPAGCRFASRCQKCFSRCTEESPVLKEVTPGHFVACHLYDQ